MLKINFYQDLCVVLHTHINPYSYRKDQSNKVNSLPTSAIRERLSGRPKPRFTYALPRRPFEAIRTDIKSHGNSQDTILVLDNAKAHRSKQMKELRPILGKR